MSEPSLEGWIRQIAGTRTASFESLEAFVQALASEKIGGPALCAAAIGGALADRLGYAFVAGYQAATRRLVAIGLGMPEHDSMLCPASGPAQACTAHMPPSFLHSPVVLHACGRCWQFCAQVVLIEVLPPWNS